MSSEFVLMLLLVVCVIAVSSQRLNISSPVILLLAGAGLTFVPGFPEITIKPELMLLIFLPPLLMEAAYFTSLRDFKRNMRPILQLAVGLVIATSAAVAWLSVEMIPGMGWAAGFVLGAIASPPDAVAATSILRRTRVPKRITSILEGESLVNDATGLILYKFAVAAVVTASFSFIDAAGQFSWMAASGIILGISVGYIGIRLFPKIQDTSVEIVVTFLLPYIAYSLAESVHGSGVLAVVAAGLVVGWLAPTTFSAEFRIQAGAVWKVVIFTLNALVFLLIGLQLPGTMENLKAYPLSTLVFYAVAVCATITIVRFAWVFIIGYATRILCPASCNKDPYPAWQNMFIISWTGVRGVVSLATALALPFTVASGESFPHRDLIIFLGIVVILFTLVVQGLTLPWLSRKLTLSYDFNLIYEDWNARHMATREALRKIDELSEDATVHNPALLRIRSHYTERLEALGDGPNTPITPTEYNDSGQHPIIQGENRIWQEVLSREMDVIMQLRRSFQISDEVMHNLLEDMDLLSRRFRYQPTNHG